MAKEPKPTAAEEADEAAMREGRKKIIANMRQAFALLNEADDLLADPSVQRIIIPPPAEFHSRAAHAHMSLTLLNIKQAANIIQVFEEE